MQLIYSVPHTGTHFIKDLLEAHGIPCKAKHVEGYKDTDELIVCPIRKPEDTYRSWMARGRPGDFLEKWKTLNEIAKRKNTVLVPIDTKDKEKHLAALGKLVGVDLVTEWNAQNEFIGERDASIEKYDFTEVYKLKVVDKFYGKKKPKKAVVKKVELVVECDEEVAEPTGENSDQESLL